VRDMKDIALHRIPTRIRFVKDRSVHVWNEVCGRLVLDEE